MTTTTSNERHWLHERLQDRRQDYSWWICCIYEPHLCSMVQPTANTRRKRCEWKVFSLLWSFFQLLYYRVIFVIENAIIYIILRTKYYSAVVVADRRDLFFSTYFFNNNMCLSRCTIYEWFLSWNRSFIEIYFLLKSFLIIIIMSFLIIRNKHVASFRNSKC